VRLFKKATVVLLGALILCAVATTTASAGFPEFLGNVTGNTFTATSIEGKLEDPATKMTIICKKDSVTLAAGNVTGNKIISVFISFEECTLAGLGANSLGDALKTILVGAKGELCYISKPNKEVGMLFTMNPVHIEIPSIAELLEVKGTALGTVLPTNTLGTAFGITLSQATSEKKCENQNADQLLLEKAHNGTTLAVVETTAEDITFDKIIEVMA
jgi:hypothetical protein